MCILIVKRGGAEPLSDQALQYSFDNNPDGAGFAGVNVDDHGRRKMVLYHSMEFEPWLAKLRRFERNNPEESMIIHTRIGTSGEESTLNCHPFHVSDGSVMAHNGIISKARKDPDGMLNDTQMFLQDTIEEMPEGWMCNDALVDLVEEYIGYSKLAFLDLDGQYTILNDHLGSWVKGVWYSNDSYKRKPYKYVAPVKKATSVGASVVTTGTQQLPYKHTYSTPTRCDKCEGVFSLSRLTPYDLYTTVNVYCDECEAEVLEDNIVYPNEVCRYNVYLDYKNGLPTRSQLDELQFEGERELEWSEHVGRC